MAPTHSAMRNSKYLGLLAPFAASIVIHSIITLINSHQPYLFDWIYVYEWTHAFRDLLSHPHTHSFYYMESFNNSKTPLDLLAIPSISVFGPWRSIVSFLGVGEFAFINYVIVSTITLSFLISISIVLKLDSPRQLLLGSIVYLNPLLLSKYAVGHYQLSSYLLLPVAVLIPLVCEKITQKRKSRALLFTMCFLLFNYIFWSGGIQVLVLALMYLSLFCLFKTKYFVPLFSSLCAFTAFNAPQIYSITKTEYSIVRGVHPGYGVSWALNEFMDHIQITLPRTIKPLLDLFVNSTTLPSISTPLSWESNCAPYLFIAFTFLLCSIYRSKRVDLKSHVKAYLPYYVTSLIFFALSLAYTASYLQIFPGFDSVLSINRLPYRYIWISIYVAIFIPIISPDNSTKLVPKLAMYASSSLLFILSILSLPSILVSFSPGSIIDRRYPVPTVLHSSLFQLNASLENISLEQQNIFLITICGAALVVLLILYYRSVRNAQGPRHG